MEQKMSHSWIEEDELKKCEKLFQNIVVCMLSCENAANTGVFGWFALRVGSKKNEENTGIYDTL